MSVWGEVRDILVRYSDTYEDYLNIVIVSEKGTLSIQRFLPDAEKFSDVERTGIKKPWMPTASLY